MTSGLFLRSGRCIADRLTAVEVDARAVVAEAVLMMQKEVAERIVAAPRTKAYGILSVVLQLYAAPRRSRRRTSPPWPASCAARPTPSRTTASPAERRG